MPTRDWPAPGCRLGWWKNPRTRSRRWRHTRRPRSSVPRIRNRICRRRCCWSYKKSTKMPSASTRPRQHSIRRLRSRLPDLANVYSKQKKLPEAEAALRRLLELDPNNSTARTQLGRVLAAEGKQGEAATALGSGASKPGGDPHGALDLGTMYVNAGNYAAAEEAIAICREGLARRTAKRTLRWARC